MNKSSNIVRWVVFGLLALISVACMILFFGKGIPETGPWKAWFDGGRMGDAPQTTFTDLLLNWSYIKVALGIVIAVIAFIVMGVIKGINWKTIIIVFGAIAIIGAVSYFLAKPYFGIEYKADAATYSGVTHGWVEMGMNFFLITFGIAIVAILFSVIYKALKR